jgi:hypothetical protein
MRKKSKMITARQFAEMHATPYTTVATWLQRELIPGAVKQELPYGGYVWMVPQDAPKPELKPGPKPKTEEDGSDAGDQVEAVADEPPAKPKRKASKRSPAKKASVTKSAKKKGARAK